jgi:hypothetical protein
VVIGAILIAPLMTPILGAAAAIVNGRTRRLARSMSLVALGVAVASGIVLAAAMVIMLPLLFTSQGLLNEVTRQSAASETVPTWMEEASPELTFDLVEVARGVVSVEVSGPRAPARRSSRRVGRSQGLARLLPSRRRALPALPADPNSGGRGDGSPGRPLRWWVPARWIGGWFVRWLEGWFVVGVEGGPGGGGPGVAVVGVVELPSSSGFLVVVPPA